MFDGRIYRAAFIPLLFVLVVVGFSLSGRPGRLASTLAPDAFDGEQAFATLRMLAAAYPQRRPGGAADQRLAAYVQRAIQGAGGAGGGFQVSVLRKPAPTIDGERTLTTVVARRAGSTGEGPIAVLAHRDAALPGSAAELSGTAALLELARVFAHSETRRTIVLVSTSGGSGGDAGAAEFASAAAGSAGGAAGFAAGAQPLDAAIVLGDLAGASARRPFVDGFSSGSGSAPEQLTRTVQAAISQEVGVGPGDPGLAAQLAHLSFPLRLGEQGPLDAAGIPAVLVQVSGERGPRASDRVSQVRLQAFGRAVLSAVYALDEAPDIQGRVGSGVVLGRKLLPAWAVRVLVLALLFPPLVAGIDALARLRRRREPLGRPLAWVASCSLPLLATALFAMVLGRLGILAAPPGQPSAQALASLGSLKGAAFAAALVLALGLAAWPASVRRLGLALRAPAESGAVALLLVLLAVSLLVWALNPFACLLLVPATHGCLLGSSLRDRTRAAVPLALALALAPLGLLMAVYAHELGLGPVGLAQSAVLALAGGRVGAIAALLWSLALGCLLALPLLGGERGDRPNGAGTPPPQQILTRGPLSYAGPGSLGGTESALRR